ncbi:MAG TPA: NlpC/P60 family protein [Gaiellaceae bacterium]|nr:NlpC/P60 family protein [Gaiellaceae bacterium]
MAELQQLNGSLEQTIQQYDSAKLRYARVEHDLKLNRQEFKVAKRNLQVSQRNIAARLVTLYTTPKDSTLEVILGAKNLDDMLNRLNTARSVTAEDSTIVKEVQQFRREVKRNGALLAVRRRQAKRLVSLQASRKRQIENKLAEQNRLLSSIKGQIAQIEAAQQARALAMARRAQQQLAAEQAAQRAAAQTSVVGVTATALSDDTSTDPVSIAAPTSGVGGGAVAAAMSQIGKPYVWAAAGPDSYDCSGLTSWAYAQVGVSLPHSSYDQWNYGVPVSKDQLEPGDLVFFDGLGHVGIYVGGGAFVHAPHTGTDVQVSDLTSGYYAENYVGARRIL